MTSVHIEPAAGNARFRMENLAITDYGSITNGLFYFASPTPGHVTFDVEWSGVKSRHRVRNADVDQHFGGEFVTTATQASWHDSNGGTLVFESSDDGQSTNRLRLLKFVLNPGGSTFGRLG